MGREGPVVHTWVVTTRAVTYVAPERRRSQPRTCTRVRTSPMWCPRRRAYAAAPRATAVSWAATLLPGTSQGVRLAAGLDDSTAAARACRYAEAAVAGLGAAPDGAAPISVIAAAPAAAAYRRRWFMWDPFPWVVGACSRL